MNSLMTKDTEQLLSRVCARVLNGPACDDRRTVELLVPYLLTTDAHGALAIAEREASRPDIAIGLKAIWETALFLVGSNTYQGRWRTFVSSGEDFDWEVLDLLAGNDLVGTKPPMLTPEQRGIVIEAIGSRIGNRPPPTGVWAGRHNAWDATSYVAAEIGRLAEMEGDEGETILRQLLLRPSVGSYHELIRHRLAERARRHRDLEFVFASPDEIARAIDNQAPATPADLLAYTVDHLCALNREIKSTQMEVYRAYWNHRGKTFFEPKYEEDCSGLLANDLQHRVRSHGLVVTVEHHMVANKECDLVVRQGVDRLVPIEVKHHYHAELWTAWRTQLDRTLYSGCGRGGAWYLSCVLVWGNSDEAHA